MEMCYSREREKAKKGYGNVKNVPQLYFFCFYFFFARFFSFSSIRIVLENMENGVLVCIVKEIENINGMTAAVKNNIPKMLYDIFMYIPVECYGIELVMLVEYTDVLYPIVKTK